MTSESSDFRSELCKALGISSIAEAHEIIIAGAREGVERLLEKRLDAKVLKKLGYGASGMEKMGYKKAALERLGYYGAVVKREEAPVEQRSTGKPDDVRQLISSGYRAGRLKEKGLTVHECRKAGCSAGELMGLGFSLPDMAAAYSCAALRTAGFGANELRKYFSGAELRESGFSARDMRIAGFTIKELLKSGYNENHVVTAGYSINELVREGLSTRTKQRVKGM